jgi:hypothetical protein
MIRAPRMWAETGKAVGLAEYLHINEPRDLIGRSLWKHNHNRPHRGPRDRAPREAFLRVKGDPETRDSECPDLRGALHRL